MTEQNVCADCGKPALGTRCRACHGLSQKVEAAEAMAPEDKELLRLVDEDHLSAERVATRLGISRQWATRKIKKARERQALLAGLVL